MKNNNMLIAQSGGPSMVINQSLVGAVMAAKKNTEIGEIFGALHGIQGILNRQFIDLRKESDETLLRVAKTPSSALGSVRKKPTTEDCRKIFKILHEMDIRYFFYIGGNDSAETANIINQQAVEEKYSLKCFHIPKTIDNDLLENDHTPGYGSAARFVASAIRGDDFDNRALGGVKIDVIMGRNAGFLTAAAAVARQEPDDGPHLIYLPERPFEIENFVSDVDACMKKFGRCVIAVSEGIRDVDGKTIAEKFSTEIDAHGNVNISGAGLGENLASVIRTRLNVKRVRADTFGFIQRCFVGATSDVDTTEAWDVGAEAVKAATSGISSGSVAITRKKSDDYAIEYKIVPLESVAKRTRCVPDEFISAEGNNVTDTFIKYAKPIIGDLPETDRFDQLKNI